VKLAILCQFEKYNNFKSYYKLQFVTNKIVSKDCAHSDIEKLGTDAFSSHVVIQHTNLL